MNFQQHASIAEIKQHKPHNKQTLASKRLRKKINGNQNTTQYTHKHQNFEQKVL